MVEYPRTHKRDTRISGSETRRKARETDDPPDCPERDTIFFRERDERARMPSTSTHNGLAGRVATQRNLTILVAILVAVPAAYGFRSAFGGDGLGGSFLLLMTLAVGVPTAYDNHWPQYDRKWIAVGWVIAACVVATAEFVGLYLFGTAVLGLTPLVASVGAFLVTDLGNLAWLAVRKRRRNDRAGAPAA